MIVDADHHRRAILPASLREARRDAERLSLAGVMGSVAAFPLPAPAGGDSRLVVWVFGVTQAGAPYRRFEYGESVRLGWAAG